MEGSRIFIEGLFCFGIKFKIPLSFFDGGPEAEVHRPKDDQTSSDMKGVEDSF